MTRALEPAHPAPRQGMGIAGQAPGSLSQLAGDLLAGEPSACCTCWGAQVTVASRLRAGEELPVECGRVGTNWNSPFSALNHRGIQRGESSNVSLLSSKSCRFHFCSNNPEYKREKIFGNVVPA